MSCPVDHLEESPQTDRHEVLVSLVFNNLGLKAHKDQHNRGEQQFNVEIRHVQIQRHLVIHRLRKEQIHRRVHHLLEAVIVISKAAAQADQDDKMIKE